MIALLAQRMAEHLQRKHDQEILAALKHRFGETTNPFEFLDRGRYVSYPHKGECEFQIDGETYLRFYGRDMRYDSETHQIIGNLRYVRLYTDDQPRQGAESEK